MFGQDVFTPQTRLFNPDHDKVLEQAKQSSNVNLVLNRSPRRFVIGYITIESMATKQNAIGDVVCRLNEGTEHQIDIPLGENSTKFGETTEEAVQNALKDKNSKAVFSDPKDWVAFLTILTVVRSLALMQLLSRLIRLRLSVCLPLQQTRRSLQTTSVRRQILNQLIR